MKPTPITNTCCSLNMFPMMYFFCEILITGIVAGIAHNEVLESKLCGYIIWAMLLITIVDVVTAISVVCSWSVWQISFSAYWLNAIAKLFSWYSLVTVVIPGGANATHEHNVTICTIQPYFDELSIMTWVIIAVSIVMFISLSIVSCLLAGRAVDPILNAYSESV